jgi:citrate lyase beta subunit
MTKNRVFLTAAEAKAMRERLAREGTARPTWAEFVAACAAHGLDASDVRPTTVDEVRAAIRADLEEKS